MRAKSGLPPSVTREAGIRAAAGRASERRAGRHRHQGQRGGSAEVAGLPPVWRGTRRRLLVLLVLTGLALALSAGAGAYVLHHALRGGRQANRAPLFWLLVAAAVAVGLLKMAERVLTERLSQHYVHEIRVGLVRHNLTVGLTSSVGVTVARTTNDLTSVKNWVSMGLAPLAVGIPLILGTSVVLALMSPALVVAVLVPLALLAAMLRLLTPPTYTTSRELRRARGRLSAHVADAVLAADSIRSAGGVLRELNRIERLSARLVTAAITRARYAGALRGSAAATVGLITALIIGFGILIPLPTATIAAALTVVGFLAPPIQDVGRVAEYRQAYRAARRIIAPALGPEGDPALRAARSAIAVSASGAAARPGVVLVEDLTTDDGRPLPNVRAGPGDRIAVDHGDRATTSRALSQLVGLVESSSSCVFVDGVDLTTVDHRHLRALVGYAAQGMLLARGSIARAVLYRSPTSPAAVAHEWLERVGLGPRVRSLPRGVETVLRHGGDPLTIPERARLLLARALLDTPPLLVLDHLDDDLGHDGRATLREVLRSYPGVVLIASDQPEKVVDVSQWWGNGPSTSGRASLRVVRP